jgi:hypothetical protein
MESTKGGEIPFKESDSARVEARDCMMQQQPTAKAETLATEPEIIPPDADWPSSSRI